MAPKLFVELSFWKFVSEAESSMKFARLNALKNSARNWSFQRSVKEKFLESPMSHVYAPGKRKLFLPMVPKVPSMSGLFFGRNFPGFLGSGWVGSGTVEGSNARGLSQFTQDTVITAHAPGAYALLPLTHGSVLMLFGGALAALGFGPVVSVPRSCPILVPDAFVPCRTVKGRPVCAETTPPSSQPPKTCRRTPFVLDRPGSCHT